MTNHRISALIRMLASSNDNEALTAVRALIKELASNGEHLEALARVWESAQAQRPTQPKKPFDYTKIETAVTLYAEGKDTVFMNKTIRAVREMVAGSSETDTRMVSRYITARLRALGFKPSQSGLTYSRR